MNGAVLAADVGMDDFCLKDKLCARFGRLELERSPFTRNQSRNREKILPGYFFSIHQMEKQDVLKAFFILGAKQGVECSWWQLGESGIGWSKKREGAFAAEKRGEV